MTDSTELELDSPCEKEDHNHRACGVGENEKGEYVLMWCIDTNEYWEEYREWNIS